MNIFQLATVMSKVAESKPASDAAYSWALSRALSAESLELSELAELVATCNGLSDVPAGVSSGVRIAFRAACDLVVLKMADDAARLEALSGHTNNNLNIAGVTDPAEVLERGMGDALTTWGTDWLESYMGDDRYDEWLDSVCDETQPMPTLNANEHFRYRLSCQLAELI